MQRFLYIITLLLSFTTFGSEVNWTSRLEGSRIVGGQLKIEDGDFGQLSTLKDLNDHSYLRLGLTERSLMEYLSHPTRVELTFQLTRYNSNGTINQVSQESLSVVYSPNGDGGISNNGVTIDAEDFRMNGTHKFLAEVTSVTVKKYINNVWVVQGSIPSFLYLEGGFSSERYYPLLENEIPQIYTSLVEYDANTFAEIKSTPMSSNQLQTSSTTEEIELSWNYIYGAEEYELEWFWVDNYDRSMSSISLSEFDFHDNCARIRLRNNTYRLTQTFAKGYLVYRVRAIGRWFEDVSKDKYGQWSSSNSPQGLNLVSDWPHVLEIVQEHENSLNWQYQATYAEDGKRKEVIQYMDGSQRNRLTVTKLNSNNQTVVGETIYDNEGRGVIQMLPVPQDNPALKYYPSVNQNTNNVGYNFENFDLETTPSSNSTPSSNCTVVSSDPVTQTKGAGLYYSVKGHENDADWQRNVPDSKGYPFTQVEYTNDNTGRIARQSGVGNDHKIGSNHETVYYYLQPSQEELNRLFGYKVGYKQRYKKNLVVDANGQVSVSYLDAQGRVIATGLAGANTTPLETLPGAPDESLLHTDLLNKLNDGAPDTPADDNKLESTGRFGSEKDALQVTTVLGVVSNNTTYNFKYDAKSGVYTEAGCNDQPGTSYPYVYDLTISIKDKCGNELFTQTETKLGTTQIDGTADAIITQATNSQTGIVLDLGTYTVFKELKVNEEAYNTYLNDYLSKDGNPCLAIESDFSTPVEDGCELSCEECVQELGTEGDFVLERAKELHGSSALVSDLSAIDLQTAKDMYQSAKAECMSPCTPLVACDSYWEMLKGDLAPQGQYGAITGSTSMSIYSESNNLSGNWTTPTYTNADGTPSLLEITWNASTQSYEPAIKSGVSIPVPDSEGRRWILPTQLANVSDFISYLPEHPEWLDQLVVYHPEYKLYSYVDEICSEEYSVPARKGGTNLLVGVNSEAFDVYLRDFATSYQKAITGTDQNIYINQELHEGIFYFGSNPDVSVTAPIYNCDPFFRLDYNVHTLTNTRGLTYTIYNNDRKRLLMEYALDVNYNKSGMSMLKFAVTAVMGGYLPVNISNFDTWSEIATNLPLDKQDKIWQQYKSYYLSEKQRINQLCLDLYGFNQDVPLYNGAMGTGDIDFGIALEYEGTPNYIPLLLDVYKLFGIFNFPPTINYFPTFFASSDFDSKQYRIGRANAANDSSQDDGIELEEMAQQADYELWQSTGLCPLTIDMEHFLNQLAIENQLTSTTIGWNDIMTLTPDLMTALTGFDMATAQTQNISVSGDVVGSTLELKINANSLIPSRCIATLPEIDATLPWINYNSSGPNGWHIYGILNSFPESNTLIKVLVRAGSSLQSAKEYVLEYTSCIDLNTCQTEYQNNTSLDADCQKEETFESALHALMNKLVQNNKLYTHDVDLSTYTEYTNSVLSTYFGQDAVWEGSLPGISNATTLQSFSIGSPLPSDIVMVNGVNIFDGAEQITINYGTYSGSTPSSLSTTSIISSNNLNFNCSCDELSSNSQGLNQVDYDQKLKNLINHFLNKAANGIAIPTGNYTCAELNALSPYYQNHPLVVLANYTSTSAMQCTNNEYLPIYQYNIGLGLKIIDVTAKTECYLSFILQGNKELLTAISSFEVIDLVSNPSTNSFSLTAVLGSNQCYVQNSSAQFTGIGQITCKAEPPCETCPPTAQSPVSCTDAYDQYKEKMLTLSIGSSTDLVDVITSEVFCGMQYAYISSAYVNYLTSMNITNTTDALYLTISEFGNTPIGYSNAQLTTAVTAFHTYHLSHPLVTWYDYLSTVYIPSLAQLCPVITPSPTFPEVVVPDQPCNLWGENISSVNAQNQYDIYLNQVAESFRHNYITGAMSTVVETFKESHAEKEYHYTLYTYNRAGDLVQTVPPKGVNRLNLDETQNSAVNNFRNNSPTETEEGTTATTNLAPTHSLQTNYRYNSLKQLVYQNTPDGSESRFAYDKLGRLVLSQNAKQKPNNNFSYTVYDPLGRVIEVGELHTTSDLYEINDIGRLVYKSHPTHEVSIDNVTVANTYQYWIDLLSGVSSRREVTRTIYDELKGENNSGGQVLVDITIPQSVGNVTVKSAFGLSYEQYNTRNRIVGVVYQSSYNTNINIYDNGTFYDYDVHGNVTHLLQVNNNADLVAKNQNIKHLDYEYDLVSGNVNKVIYQKLKQDQYMHRYNYDADNRITIAETSKDGYFWEKDAKYFYYDHGPLARTELGEQKVQSEDYAYTIQGWLKAVNGEELNRTSMMGSDGKSSGLNTRVAADAFGYSLHYFSGDYQSAGTHQENNGVITAQVNSMLNYSIGANNLGSSLYNGNIRSMYTAISDNDQQVANGYTHQTVYKYDQLNRLLEMQGYDASTGIASAYKSNYSYDGNGNLATMKNTIRDGSNPSSSITMDDFSYRYLRSDNTEYDPLTSPIPGEAPRTNQLGRVIDNGVSSASLEDLENQNLGNYGYDKIGQLTRDDAENIDLIKWTVTNKVKEVIYKGPRLGEKIVFEYDAMGHRIAKHYTKPSDGTKSTYYVLDAQGNTMCNYEYKSFGSEANKLYLSDRNIYGSKRIGVEEVGQEMVAETGNNIAIEGNYQNLIGDKRYELSNHLGNVLNVVTDRKLPVSDNQSVAYVAYYTADVVSYSDYLPFGMEMPNRHGSVGQSYRYGFQSQEMDNEIKGEGNCVNFEYRMHDPRIGRFFAIDPLAKKYAYNSPYAFSENRVIDGIELEGLEYYYSADGNLIGKLGTSTQVRVVSAKNVAKVTEFIGGATSSNIAPDVAIQGANNFSKDVGMNNEELNLRVVMTLISHAEKHSTTNVESYDQRNSARDEDGTYPTSSGISKPFGKFQFYASTFRSLLKNKNAETTPENQDKAAAINISSFKSVLSILREGSLASKNNETRKEKLEEVSNTLGDKSQQWPSLPGQSQEGVNMTDALKLMKKIFKNELAGKSSIQTPQGKLNTNLQ